MGISQTWNQIAHPFGKRDVKMLVFFWDNTYQNSYWAKLVSAKPENSTIIDHNTEK